MPVPKNKSKAAAPSASALAGMMEIPTSDLVDPKPRIVARPNWPFFLRHWPEAWDIGTEGLDKPTWLPQVVQHIMRPGAGGMRTLKKGMNPADVYFNAKRDAEREGWIYVELNEVVPADCLPPGVPEGPYFRAVACRDKKTGTLGKHYVEAWEVPVASAANRKQKFQYDRAGYNRWRASLVTRGLIPGITEDVRQALIYGAENRLGRVEVLNFSNDNVRDRRVDAQAKETAVYSEAVKLEEAAA